MKAKQLNQVNPCARVLGQIAKTCFLIGAETNFDAHFDWAAHVNQVTVRVFPKGATAGEHTVLEFCEYINLPNSSGPWCLDEFRTDTFPKVKAFSDQLAAFYEQRLQAA